MKKKLKLINAIMNTDISGKGVVYAVTFVNSNINECFELQYNINTREYNYINTATKESFTADQIVSKIKTFDTQENDSNIEVVLMQKNYLLIGGKL